MKQLQNATQNAGRFSPLELDQQEIAEIGAQILQSVSLPSDLRSLLVARRFFEAASYMKKMAQENAEMYQNGLEILLDFDLLDIFVQLIRETGIMPGQNAFRRLTSLLSGWLDSRSGAAAYESQPTFERTIENLYDLMAKFARLPLTERVGGFIEIRNATMIMPPVDTLRALIEQIEAKSMSAARDAIRHTFGV